MALNNKVELIGRLGKDPRLSETKKGELMASFSLATQDSYLGKDDQWLKKEAIWHNVLVFNKELANTAKILAKGSRVKITGSLSYQSFPYKPKGRSKALQKKEASIIAHKLEPAPLENKREISSVSEPINNQLTAEM